MALPSPHRPPPRAGRWRPRHMALLVLALLLAGSTSALTATSAFAAPAGAPHPTAASPSDPTSGMTRYTDTYYVQHPYNLPVSARFSITGGVYNTWILKGDAPFSPGSSTGPRTEMRWESNWTSGDHLWEADVKIRPGTQGTCIMQVKTNAGGEAMYLETHNHGNLYNSVDTPVAANLWGVWFHLDVSFDPTTHIGRVWVNNHLALTVHYDQLPGATWYFKNGTYGIIGSESEAHFRNIEFFRSTR